MRAIFKRTHGINPADITNVLENVIYPRTGKSVIASGLISDIKTDDSHVRLTITIQPEEEKSGIAIQDACREAVLALDGVEQVTPILTAERTPAETPPRKAATWNTEPLPHVGRIIAIASGKGGVGKSTTTVQLARALAKKGLRTGILDADIYGPSIPRMLGLNAAPDTADNQFIPPQAHDIRAMSIGLLIPGEAAVMRGPMVGKALHQMLRNTRWGTEDEPLDTLFIDLPPGTGDVHLSLMQQVPLAHNGGGAIIVTTPQEVALEDARKAILMFEKIAVPVLGIIENMSFFEDPSGAHHAIFGSGGGASLSKEYTIPLLGQIPLIAAIGQAADQGEIAENDRYDHIVSSLINV